MIRSGGRLTIVDWDGAGDNDCVPPLDERYTASEAVGRLDDAGFGIERLQSWPEIFLLVTVAT